MDKPNYWFKLNISDTSLYGRNYKSMNWSI